jgi:hypothetical protein
VLLSLSARFFAEYLQDYIDGTFIKCKNNTTNIIDNILIRDNNILIIGFYNPRQWNNEGHYKSIIENCKSIIIYFVGFDVEQLTNPNSNINSIKNNEEKNSLKKFFKENNKKIKFISENNYQAEIMKKNYDLDVTIVPMPIKNTNILDKSINFPIDNLHIGIYVTSNRKSYNFDIIMEVIRKSPKYRFYLYCNGGFKKQESDIFPNNVTLYETETPIETIYKIINCGIRITNFDGEPQTGIELLILGKYFIFNHKMQFCNYVEKDENIVTNIISELNKIKDNLIFNKKSHEYYKTKNCPISFSKKINLLFKES